MPDNHEACLTRFLDAMDAAEFDDALALFAVDASYLRPTLNKPGAPLGVGTIVYHGREEIAKFMAERGARPMRQRVIVSATNGQHLFAEGLIEFQDGTPDMSPLFHLVFNDGGLIERFVAVR